MALVAATPPPTDVSGSPALTQGFNQGGDVGGTPTTLASKLANFVRRELDDMARFRTTIGLDARLTACAEMRDGRYSATQLSEIKKFGGSEVFVRLASNKVRGSYAMLSQIFTTGDRPWEIQPTPDPTLPEDIYKDIKMVMVGEAQALAQAGMPVDEGQLINRANQLMVAARDAGIKRAKADAELATQYMDDILVEGGFYEAMREFLIDFSTYPLAIMAGPMAVMRTDVRYVNGQPQRERRPVLEFRRVNPRDFLWSSGATRIEDAGVIERASVTRAQLASLIGLEGYDDEAVRSVLRDYTSGHTETQFEDGSRNRLENQQSPGFNDMIDMLTYMGAQPGWLLEEWGFDDIPDTDLDYLLQVVMVGEYVLKIAVDPDPRARVPYYVAPYEPVPGSIAGNALCELMQDIQEVCNAIGRAGVNNLAIASGPQVVVDIERMADSEDIHSIYPWKVWHTTNDPSITSLKPIEFFQPNMNLQELISAFQFFSNLGDEVSAIPRYLTGNERVGGAGRTASGLSMLMSNANKSMISIASVIDSQILSPLLQKMYDLVLLTTGNQILRGDENIVVRGATYAETKETDRMRMIEFAQMTGNPIDMQIMGLEGRAAIIKKLAGTFGLQPTEVVPQTDAALQGAQQGMQQPGAPQPGAPQPGAPQPEKDPRNQVAEETDNAQRTRGQSAIARGR